MKRAFFAADSWKARATGKELSSPSCAFLSYAHCAGLKRTLLKHRCTTLHLSVGPVHFSLFLSSPNGRGKNLFSFLSPSSRTVPFFAGYHRNILSISSVRKGRQEQKGGMSAFLSGLPSLPFQPLHPVNEGCYHRIEEPCYTLFCLYRKEVILFSSIRDQ